MRLLGKKMYEGYVAVSAAKSHFSIHFSDEAFLNRLSENLSACKSGGGKHPRFSGDLPLNGTEEIGFCGAYCGTCREYQKPCQYLDGSRDLSRAKCRMKKCCLTRGHITCGDCGEYESCQTVQPFLNHPGYKYGKYPEQDT